MQTIDIGKHFSRTPLGRYHPNDGPATGQRFREEFLVPALNENSKVTVIIDHAEGYGSSFLEEAFGGLVRKEGFTKDMLENKLEITFENPDYQLFKNAIWRHITAAKPA